MLKYSLFASRKDFTTGVFVKVKILRIDQKSSMKNDRKQNIFDMY